MLAAVLLLMILIPALVIAKSVTESKKQKPIENETKIIASIQKHIEKPEPLSDFPRGTYPKPPKPMVAQYIVHSALNNEHIVWDFLIKQGFTRNQVAGIMGNLQQEHGFQTSGDGLAQWIGGRKTRLMAMADPYNIYTQLNFLMTELNESYIGNSIKATNDVVTVTRIFQNQFERCGICNEGQRIAYAWAILARH